MIQQYSTRKHLVREKPAVPEYPGEAFQTSLYLKGNGENRRDGGLRTRGIYKQNLPGKPLASVITVVFNGDEYLENTIQSVLHQTYDNVEYIIVDGGSEDRSLEIVKSYNDAVDYWVSEPDEGIYDAMNKGLRLATGSIVGIVNADDCLYLNALDSVAGCFLNDPELSYTYGAVDRIDRDGRVYGKKHPLPEDQLRREMFRQIPFPHLSMFVSLKTYKSVGLYDTKFRVGGDYDFVLRMLSTNAKGFRLREEIGQFRTEGSSGGLQTFLEARRIQKKHGVALIRRELNFIASMTKYLAYSLLPFWLFKRLKRFRKRSVNEYYEL